MLNLAAPLLEDTIESKYKILEHSIQVLKESIIIVEQTASFTTEPSSAAAKALSLHKKELLEQTEAENEPLSIDKSLGNLASIQFMFVLGNFYSMIPPSRSYYSIFLFDYALLYGICFLLFGSFSISLYYIWNRETLKKSTLIFTSICAIFGNVILILSFEHRSASAFLIGL